MKEPKKGGKKSFSDDLESVFHQTLFEDNLQDKPTVLLQDTGKTKRGGLDKKSAAGTEAKEENKAPKTPRKSFSDNMDLLFKEGIEELLEGTSVTQIKRSIVQDQGRKAIGIDLLLQRTAPASDTEDAVEQEPMTKRVTFVVDTEKIETLKEIARNEKKRLRHIFTELIEQYIKTHLP